MNGNGKSKKSIEYKTVEHMYTTYSIHTIPCAIFHTPARNFPVEVQFGDLPASQIEVSPFSNIVLIYKLLWANKVLENGSNPVKVSLKKYIKTYIVMTYFSSGGLG